MVSEYLPCIILVLKSFTYSFGIKILCYMSHLQILTCPVQTMLKTLD